MPQRDVDPFQLRQVNLAHLRLVRQWQGLIQAQSVKPRFAEDFEDPLRQHRIEVSNANSLAIQLLQEPLNLLGQERLLNCALQPGELLRLLNLDGSLFKRHCHPRDIQSLERETGIEPATNSLEVCDCTTELLPRNPAVSYQPSALNLSG